MLSLDFDIASIWRRLLHLWFVRTKTLAGNILYVVERYNLENTWWFHSEVIDVLIWEDLHFSFGEFIEYLIDRDWFGGWFGGFCCCSLLVILSHVSCTISRACMWGSNGRRLVFEGVNLHSWCVYYLLLISSTPNHNILESLGEVPRVSRHCICCSLL